MVHLSDRSKIAVFEGDEYLSSPIDRRPKFHHYHPDIAILTGIAWDHMNVFPTFENYVEQFALFTQQITPNGKLIYYENDENLRQIASRVPASVQAIPYTSFPHYTEEGTTYLAGSLPTPIQVFGEHNLQNISAAYLACKELGIDETAFLKAIATYKGAAKRLQKIAEQNDTVVFLDFAHSPSKLQATIKAVREQYPRRKLIACMELHTFSSLNAAFLPQYRHTMDLADEAIVFFNPEVVKHLKLLKSNMDYGMFLPLQKAAIAAITGDQSCVETTRAAYEKRRDVLCDGLSAIGWKFPKPEATMFVWAPIPESFTSSEAFAVELVKRSGVLVTPGSAFGPAGEGYVRMALVQDEPELKQGIAAIDACGILK